MSELNDFFMFLLSILTFSIVGSVIGIVVMSYLSVTAMNNRNLRLRPASEAHYPDKYRRVGHYHKWAKQKGFRWCGGYTMKAVVTLFIACWEHRVQPAYFCIYVHKKTLVFDIVTQFKNGSCLTTTNTKDGHLLPTRDNDFNQSFKSQDPDTLMDKHIAAEKYLIKKYGLKKVALKHDFEEAVIGGLHRQTDYVRTHFMWPIRAIYWYFVVRHLKHDIPIQNQNLPEFLDDE